MIRYKIVKNNIINLIMLKNLHSILIHKLEAKNALEMYMLGKCFQGILV